MIAQNACHNSSIPSHRILSYHTKSAFLMIIQKEPSIRNRQCKNMSVKYPIPSQPAHSFNKLITLPREESPHYNPNGLLALPFETFFETPLPFWPGGCAFPEP